MPLTNLRGHQEIYHRLLRELQERPSHAYLFCGPRGIGKALVTEALVHSIVCERSPGGNFCCTPDSCPIRAGVGVSESSRGRGPSRGKDGEGRPDACECCAACVQIANGVHPDVAHVERAENRTDVLIEQVREMISQLGLRPARAPMRLVILDDAETLNVSAQNALLKTLEEPPGHAIIFLVSASEHVLLDTVRSRLRPVRFVALAPADLTAILNRHGISDPKRAGAVALMARGSAARALAVAEGDEPPLGPLLEKLRAAKKLDFAAIAALAQEFFGQRDQASDNLELIVRLLQEIVSYKLLGEEFAASTETASVMKDIAAAFSLDALVQCLGAAIDARTAIDAMANSRLQAEQLWMTIADAAR